MSGTEGSRKEVTINVDRITYSLQRELLDLQAPSNECSIYKVPHRLRDIDDWFYSPQVISIGPLHHGKEELQAMEEHKKMYLLHFLKLSGSTSLKEFVEFIGERETQLRNGYAETIRFGSEEFVTMVLVDAAFIILLFLQNTFKLHQLADDRIFGKPNMIFDIKKDLLLLENQLPFFILEDLYKFSKLPEFFQKSYTFRETSDLRNGVEFIKLTHLFFQAWIRVPGKVIKNYSTKVEHLAHYLRICCIPPGKHLERKQTKSLNIPSAVELDQAGVKFKPGSSTNLFDITFRDGILEIPPLKITDSTEVLFHSLRIPPLKITDSTEVLFHSLRAFEQCHFVSSQSFFDRNHIDSTNEECHCLHELFSDYTAFMFGLVKGPKDAELLIQKGVILNRSFGNEEISSFFHKLDKGNAVSRFNCYSNLIEDLNIYSSATLNKWKATLKQGYFKTPWMTIPVLAAALLLVLTIIQTVCSILQI